MLWPECREGGDCAGGRSPFGLPYGSLRGRVVIAAQSSCPDAQRQRQPQESGEAAGDHGRGGSGFPPSPGLNRPLGRIALGGRGRAGHRVSGGPGLRIPGGTLPCRPRAWGPGVRSLQPGLQGPCPSTLARPTPDRISYWGAWRHGFQEACLWAGRRGRGARRAWSTHCPGSRSGRVNLKPRWVRHVFHVLHLFPRKSLMSTDNRFLLSTRVPNVFPVMTVLRKAVCHYNDRFPCDSFREKLSFLFPFF